VGLPKRIEENKRSSDRMIHCHVSDHAIAGMCPIGVVYLRLPHRPLATRSQRWRGLHHHPPSSPSPLDPTTPPPLIRSPHDIGVYPLAALRHCHHCSPFTSALSSRVGPRQGGRLGLMCRGRSLVPLRDPAQRNFIILEAHVHLRHGQRCVMGPNSDPQRVKERL
jgi:hypothetical protein